MTQDFIAPDIQIIQVAEAHRDHLPRGYRAGAHVSLHGCTRANYVIRDADGASVVVAWRPDHDQLAMSELKSEIDKAMGGPAVLRDYVLRPPTPGWPGARRWRSPSTPQGRGYATRDEAQARLVSIETAYAARTGAGIGLSVVEREWSA